MKPSSRIARALLRRPGRRSQWRFWVALGAAIALILPSVALLPGASLEFEPKAAHDHSGAEHSHADRSGAGGDSRARMSDIPGSPTHPINHDCTPCQVIKYLTTSFLPRADIALLPPEFNDAPPTDSRHQPDDIGRVAVSPPIRAPPYLPV